MTLGKVKLLIIIPNSEGGSSMIFSKRQAASIDKSLFEVKIFFLSSRTSISKLFSESKRFRSMVKSFRPDCLHSHYGTMTAFFCAINANVPLIITFHGSDLNKTPGDGMLRDLFGRIFSQISTLRASKIICVSQSLEKALWWSQSKATVLPVGVNTEKFIQYNLAESREKLGWKTESKFILFNGNAIVKRFDIANEVFSLVKKEIPKCELCVLKGDTDPELMPFYLSASDCLLLCSDSEGSPMMVKEALACNLPVVGIDVGDVSERISDVKNCVITKKIPVLLSEEIIKLLKRNERTNGREKLIADGLTESKVSERLGQVYREVCGKKSE